MSYKNGLIEDLTYGGRVKEIERVLPYQDYLNVPHEDFHLQFKEKCVEWNSRKTLWKEIEEWVYSKIRINDMLLADLFTNRAKEIGLFGNSDDILSDEVYINMSIPHGIFDGITIKYKH